MQQLARQQIPAHGLQTRLRDNTMILNELFKNNLTLLLEGATNRKLMVKIIAEAATKFSTHPSRASIAWIEARYNKLSESHGEFHNGQRVCLKPDWAGPEAGEVFTLSQVDHESGRAWLGDKSGAGWYVRFNQITPCGNDSNDDEDEYEADVFNEDAEQLDVGDDVIITGNVAFNGKTGTIDSFGKGKAFVVVNLYNYGKHSFHSSDVEFNEYADSDDELDDMMNSDGHHHEKEEEFFDEIDEDMRGVVHALNPKHDNVLPPPKQPKKSVLDRLFNKQKSVQEGYWQDAVEKTEKARAERKGKPFEKNPLSHDENGVYVGDKDLDGKPVPKKVKESGPYSDTIAKVFAFLNSGDKNRLLAMDDDKLTWLVQSSKKYPHLAYAPSSRIKEFVQSWRAKQQNGEEVDEAKYFRTAYGWAGGRNEKTGKMYKRPDQIKADLDAKKKEAAMKDPIKEGGDERGVSKHHYSDLAKWKDHATKAGFKVTPQTVTQKGKKETHYKGTKDGVWLAHWNGHTKSGHIQLDTDKERDTIKEGWNGNPGWHHLEADHEVTVPLTAENMIRYTKQFSVPGPLGYLGKLDDMGEVICHMDGKKVVRGKPHDLNEATPRLKEKPRYEPGTHVEIIGGTHKGKKGRVVARLKGSYNSPYAGAEIGHRVSIDGKRYELVGSVLKPIEKVKEDSAAVHEVFGQPEPDQLGKRGDAERVKRLKARNMPVEVTPEKQFRICVVVSDPNASMVIARKNQIQKYVKVKATEQAAALTKARNFYKKQGYRVHDAWDATTAITEITLKGAKCSICGQSGQKCSHSDSDRHWHEFETAPDRKGQDAAWKKYKASERNSVRGPVKLPKA